MINDLTNSVSQIQRLSLKQLFVSSPDGSSVKSFPLIGDLTSPGIVAWTTKIPFNLSTTSKSYSISFGNGVVFNEVPNISFSVQMDNANFGVIPIITNLSTGTLGITLKVVSGSPDSTNLVSGVLHITAIGYH
jgi:hypothetical protein